MLYRMMTMHVRGLEDAGKGKHRIHTHPEHFPAGQGIRRTGLQENALSVIRVQSVMVWSGCSLAAAALHLICLWALLPLDDVELDFVALFEGFVAVELNRAVVHEDIWPIIPADETVALRIVEPLHLAFVLGHVSVTSLQSRFERWHARCTQRVGRCIALFRTAFVLRSRWALELIPVGVIDPIRVRCGFLDEKPRPQSLP
jgi:hypothetical protein